MKRKLLDMAEQLMVPALFCLLVSICFGLGRDAGSDRMEKKYQAELVNRGYAVYNPTNGVWQWK